MIQSLNYDKVQREMRVNSDFDYLHIDSFIRFTIMLVSWKMKIQSTHGSKIP